MKKYLLLLGVLVSQIVNAQTTNTTKSARDISIVYEQEQANIKAIQAILDNQITAWNKGDIDAFMVGYLESDSLVFIGKSGPTYGYQNTLANYKKATQILVIWVN